MLLSEIIPLIGRMMMKSHKICLPIAILVTAAAGQGPTTRPADSQTAATQRASTRSSKVLEPVKEGTTQPASAPAAAQFADGLLLSDLVGSLDHEKNGQAIFVFDYKGKRLRMAVLPNTYLARMEASASSDPSAHFRVTGRSTSYRGHNHILIQEASLMEDDR